MNYLRNVSAKLLAVILSVGLAPVASASILVQLDSITPDPLYDYLWSFSITATPTDGFFPDYNPYFTIYGLPGTTNTVEAPQYWQASGGAGSVTFRWGADSAPEVPGSATSYLNRGPFKIFLTVGTLPATDLTFAWQDYTTYPQTGELQSGRGTVVVGNGVHTSVPEPETLALLGLGLAGLVASRRDKR